MPSYWEQKRREPRVNLRVPVKLTGIDTNGNSFSENSYTENVSRSGALVLIHHKVPIGAYLQIEAFNTFRGEAVVQIVWMETNNAECYKAGIQFTGPVKNWIIK